MLDLVLFSTSISIADPVTLNFLANKHPYHATWPHPVRPSASSSNPFTSENHAVHYITLAPRTLTSLYIWHMDSRWYTSDLSIVILTFKHLSQSGFTLEFVVNHLPARCCHSSKELLISEFHTAIWTWLVNGITARRLWTTLIWNWLLPTG